MFLSGLALLASYTYPLVDLSVSISILEARAGFDLGGRVAAGRDGPRRAWLIGEAPAGALAPGQFPSP
jgi:hypothetical protein